MTNQPDMPSRSNVDEQGFFNSSSLVRRVANYLVIGLATVAINWLTAPWLGYEVTRRYAITWLVLFIVFCGGFLELIHLSNSRRVRNGSSQRPDGGHPM
jgi:hypothetical protein